MALTDVFTDVVGSLRVRTPEEAVDLQLPIELDFNSDGQGYCFVHEDANLPFLLDCEQRPLLPQITVEEPGEDRRHRIVKLRAKLKDAIEPSQSLTDQWYESAAKRWKDEGGDLERLKLIHPLPLMVLNTFTIQSVQDVYGDAPDELLWDIEEQLILPRLEYHRGKYPLKYFQGDDVAIFDGDIHSVSLINEEFSVIEDMSKRCQEWDIKFACYAPDVPPPSKPMPDPVKPARIRQKLLSVPGIVSWMFFYEGEKEEDFEKKLRFTRRHKGEDVILALGLLEPNKKYREEDINIASAKLKRAIEFLGLRMFHISPMVGFKGVESSVAENQMQTMVHLKSIA